jgi:hypothetical protein
MFDFNLAGCELEDASIAPRAEGGATYSVICKAIPEDTLACLLHAAQLGNTLRVVFGKSPVMLSELRVEPLASGAVRVAGKIVEASPDLIEGTRASPSRSHP